MAIKRRQTLYSIFTNGRIPTQNDFRDLIDSALNRRDDHFFGWWQSGTRYCKDDVVIYDKELYQLFEKETEALCPPGENSEDKEAEEECYCSVEVPPKDKEHWRLLELELKDKDWEIVCEPEDNPECEVTKVYQKTAKIGIGTDTPEARLDITNQNKILLEPYDYGSPDISLRKISKDGDGYSENQQYVRYRLSDKVCWETDSMAYVFKKVVEEEPQAVQQTADSSESEPMPSILLMKVTVNESNIPQVGIGTPTPQGGLHVLQENRGQVIVNPANHQEPGVLIVNLEEDSNGYYFLSGINNEYTFLSTNASGGFRFKKDETDNEGILNADSAAEGKDLMAILGDGRIGVGTDDPKSYVEFTDEESGSIRFQFGNDPKDISNPALSLNNLRPHIKQPNTYMTLGVDDDYGIIVSDAPSGIVIKRGGTFGTNDNEVNVNQGKPIVFIAPEGKVGIKTNNPPNDYELDVYGHIRSLTAYLETNSKTVLKTTDLKDDNVLDKLDKLRPTRFTWQVDHLKDEGENIGFMAQNVYEQFPELVRKTGPEEKAIAYGNLTAVLVQAINEQQTKIEELAQRIRDLEERLNTDSMA